MEALLNKSEATGEIVGVYASDLVPYEPKGKRQDKGNGRAEEYWWGC